MDTKRSNADIQTGEGRFTEGGKPTSRNRKPTVNDVHFMWYRIYPNNSRVLNAVPIVFSILSFRQWSEMPCTASTISMAKGAWKRVDLNPFSGI